MRRLLTLTLFAALTTNAASAANGPAGVQARALWHSGIQAGYDALAERARTFATAAGDYCAAPNPDHRAQAEQAWREAFVAWQAVRFVDFGPIETDNRAWQFQFWPDPKNLVARKARYLLSAGEPVSAAHLDQAGVAAQGFPMAEYLLFDDRFGDSDQALPAATGCRLLGAVAGRIADNSQQLALDWRALRADYLATEAYHETTLRAGMTALAVLEERRLARPMGLAGNGKRSVYGADAWRSGTSLAAIGATVQGVRAYYWPGLAHLLTEAGADALMARIEAQFQAVLAHYPALDQPLAPLLADDPAFARVQGLYVNVAQLVTLINDQAGSRLGVTRGFNASDGD